MFQPRRSNPNEEKIESNKTNGARKQKIPTQHSLQKAQKKLLLHLATQFKKYNRFEQYSLYVLYVFSPDPDSDQSDLRALHVLASSDRDFAAITADEDTQQFLIFLKDSLDGMEKFVHLLQNTHPAIDEQICARDEETDAALACLAALPFANQTAILKRLQATTLQYLSSRIYELYNTDDFEAPSTLTQLHTRINAQIADQTPSITLVTTASFVEREEKETKRLYNPPSPIIKDEDDGSGTGLEYDFYCVGTDEQNDEPDGKESGYQDSFGVIPGTLTISPPPPFHQPLSPLSIPPNPASSHTTPLNTTLDAKHSPPKEKYRIALLALTAEINILKINDPQSKFKKQVDQIHKKFEAVQDNINALYSKASSQSERDALLTAMEKTTKVLKNEMSAQDYRAYAEGFPDRKASPEWKLVGALMIAAATALAALSVIIFAGTHGLGAGPAFGIAAASLGLGFQGYRFFTRGPHYNLAQSMIEASKVTPPASLSKRRTA